MSVLNLLSSIIAYQLNNCEIFLELNECYVLTPKILCNEQLLQERVSLQKTWGSLTMQVLQSTKRLQCGLARISLCSIGAILMPSKTPSTPTPTVNSTVNVTLLAPLISFLAMQQWSSKTAISSLGSLQPTNSTPSQHKAKRTQIRTQAFQSKNAPSLHLIMLQLQHTLVGLGKPTPPQLSCSLKLGHS